MTRFLVIRADLAERSVYEAADAIEAGKLARRDAALDDGRVVAVPVDQLQHVRVWKVDSTSAEVALPPADSPLITAADTKA